MASIRGLGLAGAAFLGAFALHIAGGATDQRWLFALAVALIYASAASFPTLALVLAGPATPAQRNIILNLGSMLGVAFTAGALWAANGRAFAWWTVPAALVLVFGVNLALRYRFRRRLGLPATVRAAR
jgi:hypothetical protein